MVSVDLRIVELLAARLCHELVSPTSAIANGVELLGEDDPEFVRQAVALIGDSSRKAGRRLQFYRLAYGTLSGGTAGPPPRELVAGLLDGGKVSCAWSAQALAGSIEWQRLGCNLLVLAVEALPRGGMVQIDAPADGNGIVVSAAGTQINFTAEARGALARETAIDELTSRAVQGYFTAMLAERMGAAVTASVSDEMLVLRAGSA